MSEKDIITLLITLALPAGCSLFYIGIKAWKKSDSTEQSKVMWGKIDVCIGVILVLFAIACFFYLLLDKVGNGSIESESSSTTTTELTETTESGKSDEIYDHITYQGAEYWGYINELRQPNGKGTMKYSDGKEYIGYWVGGIQQGQGKMIYDNGVYEGEWQNGKRNGKGTYTWNDGKKYEGSYENDVRNGKGVFSGWVDLTNGYSGTYYGESKNDKFDGSGYFLFDNGDRFDGIYKEDLYWTGIYTKKDGSQYEVVNGQQQ